MKYLFFLITIKHYQITSNIKRYTFWRKISLFVFLLHRRFRICFYCCLSGYFKTKVFENQVTSVDDLKAKIRNTMDSVWPEMFVLKKQHQIISNHSLLNRDQRRARFRRHTVLKLFILFFFTDSSFFLFIHFFLFLKLL